MIRVVIDTNITVSAFLWRGTPARILDAASEGRVMLLSSDELIVELEETLAKPKFARQFQIIEKTPADIVAQFRTLIEIVQPASIPSDAVRDVDDNAVLACALGGKAAYIISGDSDLLDLGSYENISILTVSQFLEHVNQDKST